LCLKDCLIELNPWDHEKGDLYVPLYVTKIEAPSIGQLTDLYEVLCERGIIIGVHSRVDFTSLHRDTYSIFESQNRSPYVYNVVPYYFAFPKSREMGLTSQRSIVDMISLGPCKKYRSYFNQSIRIEITY
jgi:hypothetical protein